MVIFGGTGDLARRKLAPALYNLHITGLLPEKFSMIGIGRTKKDSKEYRQDLAAAISNYSPKTWKEEKWSGLAEKIDYLSSDVEDSSSYPLIKKFLEEHTSQKKAEANYLYYLAVSPHLFLPIADNLREAKYKSSETGWRRIMIEKPFGSNLHTASNLNKVLCASFNDRNIYRIDHYLGKEMLQNIMVIRFVNTVFEPLWNNSYIDNVQITVAENEGIGNRGAYYDQTGAMRDMIQSHLLQMLAVTAMEPPESVDVDDLIQKKIELISAVRLWPDKASGKNIILGQYDGYRQEKKVVEDSLTETYAALKLAVDKPRWQGVPFFLRTGKYLEEKQARISIQFKKPADRYTENIMEGLGVDGSSLLNLLTLKVQPKEGVAFQFNIKKPATVNEIVPATMDFCQPCAYLINTPEAYERLIADAIAGDKSRFTSWDEIEKSWDLVDSIYKGHELSARNRYVYKPGSWGPSEAGRMLADLGLQWWS